MRPRIDLRFRPSLILFVDETGSCICRQFQRIVHVTGFDPILHQSVALLQINSASQGATRIDLSVPPSDEQTQQEEVPMRTLIDRTLIDVQENRRIQSITQADYPVPDTRTQIFIVGDAHSLELARVLDVVQGRLFRRGLTTLVCYVINAFRQRQMTGPLATAGYSPEELDEPESSGLSFTAERNLPNFCYLYEDMLSYPTPSFISEEESHYATAEAIFALISTGLTTEPFFAAHMQIGTQFGTYENVGSLSTGLITFPRANILEFCSAHLGISLMEQWNRDLRNQHTSANELERLQRRARAQAEDMRKWIKDSEPRPFANSSKKHTSLGQEKDVQEDLLCPTLDILTSLLKKEGGIIDEATLAEQQRQYPIQKRMYADLQEETKKLFLLFWPDNINEEYKRQRRRFAEWTRLVLERGNRAVAAWNDWDKRATRAWQSAADRINAETRAFIDYLWSKDQNGFDAATVYVNELDDQIASLYNDLSHWRAEHEESYREFLASFEQMAQDGPWLLSDSQTSNTPLQAHPTMQDQHVDANQDSDTAANTSLAGSTGNILGANPTPARIASQHLPEREERIVQNLEQRIIWHQDRIPAIPTQVVVAIPFIFALVLSTLALFTQIPRTILSIAIISASATLLVGIMHWIFRLRYIQRVEECKEDLLIFYRRYYAYRCERREDALRRNVLGPLRRGVQAIHERLNNLQQFVRQACRTLAEDALRIEEELFNSPAGLRDIFVANGERLQRTNKNTLTDFAVHISKLRAKEPLEEWHRSPANLKQQLIQRFREQNESLMEMSDEQILEQIRRFATDVTNGYLTGPHVELQTALDKPDIWREALERVATPLYQAHVGIKEPQSLFVCGRDFDIDRSTPHLPTQACPVSISGKHEWVLLAAFFRGGLPTTINPEILFPEKSSLVTPPIEDDEIINADTMQHHSMINDNDDSFAWQ